MSKSEWKQVAEPSEWDLFVLRYSPEALFQAWEWGEVQKRMGSDVGRFGLYEDNGLVGVMQTMLVRARRGSFVHVRHGPIFSKFKHAYWKSALAFLSKEARKHSCWFVRMSPLIPADDKAASLLIELKGKPAAIHRMDGEYCWVLDLDQPAEQLLQNMRKTTRYEIRKAEKEGAEVFETANPNHLADFFGLYEATSTRQGFVPHVGIREEFDVFAKKKQARLYLGKYEGKTVAAAIILYFGHQAIYHHGASVASKVPVSPLVQWEVIKDAKNRGMKVYNFWGIAPESSVNHPWRGITLFKKGFGGRSIEYMHAIDFPISPLYIVSRMVETVRRIRRGYD